MIFLKNVMMDMASSSFKVSIIIGKKTDAGDCSICTGFVAFIAFIQ